VAQDLRNLAAAQEAIGWTNLFKGRISKQWIKRLRDYIGDKATTKNNALNWATTVIGYFFTQWFKVWDQRNLDPHGHDYQGRANKLKDAAFREITHLYTFEEAVPEDIRWLFQTPLEECLRWPASMDKQLGKHHQKGTGHTNGDGVTGGRGSQVDPHCGL